MRTVFLTAATPLRPTKKLRMSNIALDLLMRSAALLLTMRMMMRMIC